ncbi:MAG: hypothetical protein IIT83_02290, partial [Bacteroidales bacterium]|nr:hypothetical protein [Bacteroidales bacterium]
MTPAEYKTIIEDNERKISELQSKTSAIDATIATESERCAKANHENNSGLRYAQRIQRAAFPQKEIGGFFDDY